MFQFSCRLAFAFYELFVFSSLSITTVIIIIQRQRSKFVINRTRKDSCENARVCYWTLVLGRQRRCTIRPANVRCNL